MRKAFCLILALALVMSCALASEKGFDGSVYGAYFASYDESTLPGWDVMSYIEPSGLLLSAYAGAAELTVDLVETEGTGAENYLLSALDGVTRYGRLVDKGTITQWTSPMGYKGAKVSYSYQSLRGESSDDEYLVSAFAAPVTDQYMLVVTVRAWGGSAESVRVNIENGFLASLSLTQKNVSTTYTAFLTDCEERDGGIYVTLDYCEPAYDTAFGFAYTLNDDPAVSVARVAEDAELWLPRMGSILYTMERVVPDAGAIKACIDEFYALNGVHAVYQVLFNENGDIIRMQHYNAL